MGILGPLGRVKHLILEDPYFDDSIVIYFSFISSPPIALFYKILSKHNTCLVRRNLCSAAQVVSCSYIIHIYSQGCHAFKIVPRSLSHYIVSKEISLLYFEDEWTPKEQFAVLASPVFSSLIFDNVTFGFYSTTQLSDSISERIPYRKTDGVMFKLLWSLRE